MGKVPLVLCRFVRGVSMGDIDPGALPTGVRSAILKKVVDAECVISHAGLRHGDYFPSNIILSGNDPADTDLTSKSVETCLKVKVIDFNIAEVLTHPFYEYREWHLANSVWSKLPSPIVRFNGIMEHFFGWIPLEDANRWL
ncbi:hypothetical protein FB567DRAFT_515865 [Paraphoma chrysanthemicola]|uniref:Protein kinase domain-containing protein n=1 Tax=Paraphoma chrysanthemicola TaxID=798071 RepID=A0A8K0RFK5_9PLEO|nr:hypothetical protein FB567DRAFT_515865 [Paraphoma chrysanthemicola]